MHGLSDTYFLFSLVLLFTAVDSKRSCSLNIEKREISSPVRYKHGLFETRHANLTEEHHTHSFRDPKIEWIRNVTYQAQFVAVTTYDRDVIVSEYEYRPIGGLRIARVTPENQVVWNKTYDLTPLSSTVTVHQQLKSPTMLHQSFVRYSELLTDLDN